MKIRFAKALLLSSFFIASSFQGLHASDLREINSRAKSSVTSEMNLSKNERVIFQLIKAHEKDETGYDVITIGNEVHRAKKALQINDKDTREELDINGVQHRVGYVAGDNNCSLNTLNELFPGLNLSRTAVLKRFQEGVDNPKDLFSNLVKRELANDLVLKLRQAVEVNNKVSFLSQDPDFVKRCTQDLFSDFLPFIDEAQQKPHVLKAYIDFLNDLNVPLLAVSETQEFLGTFGLVCQLYRLNVDLVNYSSRGQMPIIQFMGAQNNSEPKHALNRLGHFSPLCRMDDIEERDRLAAHHIQTLILPGLNIYKDLKLTHQERSDLTNMFVTSVILPQPELKVGPQHFSLGSKDELPFQLIGFSDGEVTHRWTDAQNASVIIDLNNIHFPRPKTVIFRDTSGFTTPTHTPEVTVRLNSKIHSIIKYTHNSLHTITVNIPDDLQDYALIDFFIENPIAPKKVSSNPDPRDLGIAFGMVEFNP